MRTLTASARTKALTPKGTFPFVILEIQWENNTQYYTEFPVTFNSVACNDSLISVSDFSSSGKIGSIGEVASSSIKLDDTSLLLKQKINTSIIEGTICVLYHHYDGLSDSDATIILRGKIAGPIRWSDQDRVFEFELESIQGKGEVGFTPSDDQNNVDEYVANLLPDAYGTPWPIVFGSPKKLPAIQIKGPTEEDPDIDAVYVVNLGGFSVSNVYGRRQCYGSEDGDLFQVSSSYYQTSSATLGGQSVTIITFNKPLSEYPEEKWGDEIFVDGSSSLSSNTADQIQHILETYTDLAVDATSFAAAQTAVAVAPSHFAIFDVQDAIPLVENMAWQARCILFLKNGIAYLKPLFQMESVNFTVTSNEEKLKTLKLSFTDTDNIVTVFNANWKKDYSQQKEADKTLTIKNNTARYGVLSQDYDFFIYTTKKSIQIAASFWAYKYANSWRKVSVDCFLPALDVEAYDTVQISLPIVSTFGLRGFAESVNHDLASNTISLEIELGSKAGDHSGGQPIEDPGYWTGGNYPTNGYDSPQSARVAKLICEPDPEGEFKSSLSKNAGGHIIHIENGSGAAFQAYEILWVDDPVYLLELKVTAPVYHVGTPTEDNLEPGKILFTKEPVVGYYGYGFPAGEEVWADYDLNPQNHPNYFDSPAMRIGDGVGVEKDTHQLTKARSGFKVIGIDGGKIIVTSGSIDPKLEKIKSSDAIPAYSAAEIYGYDGEHTLVRVPTQDNLPPGRVITPITDLPAGARGLGYNSFDVSAYVPGNEPSEIGVEVGTQAGSSELLEGNTGFIVIGRKEGKNQVRPF